MIVSDDIIDQLVEEASAEEVDSVLEQITRETVEECGLNQSEIKGAKWLEAQGWRVWLTTLFPFAFSEEFSDDHCQFWDLYWSVLLRIREQLKCLKLALPIRPEHEIEPKELVILYILGRGLGKSASVEPSAVMRGAILNGGYSLFISESDDQAQEHLGNTRILIEHPDSRLLEFYPDMAIADDKAQGLPALDRRELFITRCGWIARAKGLKAKMRGLRVGTRRPDDLNIDDIDDINDSIALSISKLAILKASILPIQSNQFTTVKFTQNLILEHGVMNSIYIGRSDALAERTTIGPTSTFIHFEHESYLDELEGRQKHRILPTSIPSWKGVSIPKAQKFLSDSGLETFFAEYQNEFEMAREGRVLKNYDDARMVITEEDFANVFGSIGALNSFNKYTGHDWSKTKSEYHACVAGTLAVSGMNTPLPGKLFLHNLLSFEEGTQADDVGLGILESMSPFVPDLARSTDTLHFTRQTWQELIEASLSRENLEQFVSDTTKLIKARRNILAGVIPRYTACLIKKRRYQRFAGSHDQNNDGLEVMRTAYGLPFQPVNPGETGGLEWADHYMTVDKKTRHPFFEDEQLEDGTWNLGCPGLFIVVRKEKYPYPKSVTSANLHGSDLWRFHFNNWRMRPIKITEAGAIEHGPMKMHDDAGQCLQMILFGNMISAATLTRGELVHEHVAPHLRVENLPKTEGGGLSPHDELAALIARREAEKKVKPLRAKFDVYGQRIN
jgi:hypothetical protein